jgi:hypothetical protein
MRHLTPIAALATVLVVAIQDPSPLAAKVAELERRVAILEARVGPQPGQPGVAAEVRNRLRAGRNYRASCQVACTEGGPEQLRVVIGQMRKAAAANFKYATGREPAADDPAYEVWELAASLTTLPKRYNLLDKLDRVEAAGDLVIHLITVVDGVTFPDRALALWELRKKSVGATVKALRAPIDSAAEKEAWDLAKKLLEESSGLEAALK